MRSALREMIPPALLRILNRARQRYGYFGEYSSWQDAVRDSAGYDSTSILAKVRDALLKVKSGEAVYERDSVIFDEVQYSWPLLAGLLWIASQNGNRLSLIDFGGSLGSTYFQNANFLAHLDRLRWGIVEQGNFVRCGQEHFETERLRFFYTIEECVKAESPDTILLCSVLPYLERPYELMAEVVERGFEYILVDRTPFLSGSEDRLTVQKVPPGIYEASYPAWFLGERKFLDMLSPHYELMAGFDSLAGSIELKGAVAQEKGFIFKKRGAVNR